MGKSIRFCRCTTRVVAPCGPSTSSTTACSERVEPKSLRWPELVEAPGGTAARQRRKFLKLSIDQRLLLLPPPALDLFLTIKRIVYSVVFLKIDKFYWQAFLSVVCAFTILMFDDARVEVV